MITNHLLKYPVVFVHGFGMRDNLKFLPYWGSVVKFLEGKGITTYLSGQDAFTLIDIAALQLKDRVEEILYNTGAEKVNLVAHSKGGLDSRLLATLPGMRSKIHSITTICTPHRGTSFTHIVRNLLRKRNLEKASFRVLAHLSKAMGDRLTNVEETIEQLTPENMAFFNLRVPDVEGIIYSSYACQIDQSHPSWWQRKKEQAIYAHEGSNDGVVAVSSMIWGNYCGIILGENGECVSHHDVIGITKRKGFNPNVFYYNLLLEMKKKGW